MIGYTTVKRAIKAAAGWTSAVLEPFCRRETSGRACILMYHRVAAVDFLDPKYDDWNVPPRSFERQIAGLAECAELVPLREVPERIARPSASGKPLVALTFDDGYASLVREALPVLERYAAPATIFVVTAFVDRGEVLHFDGWSRQNAGRVPPDVVRSMTWAEIESCLDTGLVSIGSHSHRHLPGMELSAQQSCEEAQRSRETLHRRLGREQGNEYAYPYGCTPLGFVTPRYVRAVKSAGYALAVCTDVGLATTGSDPFSLPRVEVHALDGRRVLRAKARGSLAPFYLVERLRSARRSLAT